MSIYDTIAEMQTTLDNNSSTKFSVVEKQLLQNWINEVVNVVEVREVIAWQNKKASNSMLWGQK